jgi:TRAP-type transport system periplasmic protein
MTPLPTAPRYLGYSVRRRAVRLAFVGTLALAVTAPLKASADPIELKLSYFGTAQAETFLCGVKPFVDSVNGEGKGLVNIQVYFNSALGQSQSRQPQLVLDGGADMALLVPGMTPYRFPDNVLLELPGIFESVREGTLVYSRLIADKALKGYDDFLVIGAYTSAPNIIHSRKPTGSLDTLKGQKIRANNAVQAEVLASLGATPTILDTTKVAQAIKAGAVDGAAFSPNGTLEFGIAPVAPYHYLLRVGTAPLVLAMSRKRFASLPQQVQTVIGKYSGKWTAVRWATTYEIAENRALAQLRADPKEHVIAPSPADLDSAQRAYGTLSESWAANGSRNRELLRALGKELAAVRSGE